MKPPRTLAGEAALLAVLVLAIALLVNGLHSNGLDLGRNYFPRAPLSDGVEPGTVEPASDSNPKHDYAVIGLEEMVAWQPYALESDGSIVILDARNQKTFDAGRIPGARICDHYHQDQFVPGLLEVMRNADMVIIYCQGGDCEDSIQLATDLVYVHGMSKELMAIFEGGYEAWTEAGHAITEGK